MFNKGLKYKFFLRTNDKVYTGTVIADDELFLKIIDRDGVETLISKTEIVSAFKMEGED